MDATKEGANPIEGNPGDLGSLIEGNFPGIG